MYNLRTGTAKSAMYFSTGRERAMLFELQVVDEGKRVDADVTLL